MAGLFKGREGGLDQMDMWNWLGTAVRFFDQGRNRMDGLMRSRFFSPKLLFLVWVERRRRRSGDWRLGLKGDCGDCVGCRRTRDSRPEGWWRRDMPD